MFFPNYYNRLCILCVLYLSLNFTVIHYFFIIQLQSVEHFMYYSLNFMVHVCLIHLCHKFIKSLSKRNKFLEEVKLSRLLSYNHRLLKKHIKAHNIDEVIKLLQDETFLLKYMSIDHLLIDFAKDDSLEGTLIRNMLLDKKYRSIIDIDKIIVKTLYFGRFEFIRQFINHPNIKNKVNRALYENLDDREVSTWFIEVFMSQDIVLR